VDSKIRCDGDALRLPAQPFEKPSPYDRPDIGAFLIATLLLSLGLWAAIWAAVASLASAVLR
jgi:hypothetical protein